MKRSHAFSATKMGLLVIGGIAMVALLKIGADAKEVAAGAIGVVGGWLTRDAVNREQPPAPPSPPPPPAA